MRNIILSGILVLAVIIGGYYPVSAQTDNDVGSFIKSISGNSKITADLQSQLIDKKYDQLEPGYYNRKRNKPDNYQIDNRNHGIFVHLPQYPSKQWFSRINEMGANAARFSWISPSLSSSEGFLYVLAPLNTISEIADLESVSYLSDAQPIESGLHGMRDSLILRNEYNPYKHYRIESVLLMLNAVIKEYSVETGIEWAGNNGLVIKDNKVDVEILCESENTSHIDHIESLGGVVHGSFGKIINAYFPVDRLLLIADLIGNGYYIRNPLRPYPESVNDSLIVKLTGAEYYHTRDVKADGVKIGVIDLGYAGFTVAQGSNDAPPNSRIEIKKDYTGSGFESGSNHGTACTEVVYDMAPEATFRLYKINNSTHLDSAITDGLANNVNIFSHSVVWFNTGWDDNSGRPCAAANNASNGGAFFVTAAGNHAQQHWQGPFNDSDNDNIHEWSGNDEYNMVTIPGNRSVSIYLQWDTSGVDTDDYDLYVYSDGNGNNLVASSVNWGEQYERLTIINNAAFPQSIWIAVRLFLGNGDIEVFTSNYNLEYRVETNSTLSPVNATGANVISVAAVDIGSFGRKSPAIESYSSRGPTNDGTAVPLITGPDGVPTITSGNFFGTSCATPAVAGALALLWDAEPVPNTNILKSHLLNRARNNRDWGTNGIDNTFGNGGLILATPVKADILSSKWQVGWENDVYGTIRVIIYDFPDSLTSTLTNTDIVPDSIKFVRNVQLIGDQPLNLPHWPGIEGPVSIAAFDRQTSVLALDSISGTGLDTCYIYGDFDNNLKFWASDTVRIYQGLPKYVHNENAETGLPTASGLVQNYPNPFNAVTTIRYDLPAADNVRLEIYNLMGQKVATLIDGYSEAGRHSVTWDATTAASGIYFYKLSAGGKVFTRRMTLLK